MSAPMWTGGPDQFQDVNPWIWGLWDDWKKAPFYPTDPPRDPGAFADSVMPLCDFPILGQGYAWFIVRYVEDYTAAWYASPPATNTSTPVIAEIPVDNDLSVLLGSIKDLLERVDDNIGLYSEGQTVLGDLSAIYARVSGGQETPPPIATTADTARILAALYYVAKNVVVPAWSIDNAEVLGAIESDGEVTRGDLGAKDEILNGKLDSLGGSLVGIDAIVDTVNVNVSALGVDTDAILELLNNWETGSVVGVPVYPGPDGVTVGSTSNISGPTTINGPMSGLLITVSSVPSGQSVQLTPNGHRYKGVGWVVFMTEDGEGEQLQRIETAGAILLPKSMSVAASAEVFCKSGSALSVKPFTIDA